MNSAAITLSQSPSSTSSTLPRFLYKPRPLLPPPFKFASSLSTSISFLPNNTLLGPGRALPEHRRKISPTKKMTGYLAARLVFRRPTPASRLLLRREVSLPAAERTKDAAAPTKELPAFDYSPSAYSGPSSDEILAKRREYLSPSILHSYKTPVRTRRTGSSR